MKKVTNIIEELSSTKSSTKKEAILRDNCDNEILKQTFKSTYSKDINFFVRNFKAPYSGQGKIPLGESLDLLVKDISGRVYTGANAKSYMLKLVMDCEEPDTLLKVINRDLECGVQKTTINKIWKDLVIDPPYQSYSLFKESLLTKFNYKGAFSDEKMDGLYADIMVWPEQVLYRSRSGKELNFRLIEEVEVRLKKFAEERGPFVAHGEGLVVDKSAINGVMERSEGNGYLNQDPKDIDPNIIKIVIWDIVTMGEYIDRKSKTPYSVRRLLAKDLVDEVNIESHFQLVVGKTINNMKEAISHFIEMRKLKKEGTVLKEAGMLWGDNKTKRGIKLKNEFDVDLVVVGTTPHKKDPKLVGSLLCRTRDNLLEVGAGSGLTDALRKKSPEYFIGQIITIKANDITNAESKDIKSLFLPRLNYKFVELRTDKSTANNLPEVIESSDSILDLLKSIAGGVE